MKEIKYPSFVDVVVDFTESLPKKPMNKLFKLIKQFFLKYKIKRCTKVKHISIYHNQAAEKYVYNFHKENNNTKCLHTILCQGLFYALYICKRFKICINSLAHLLLCPLPSNAGWTEWFILLGRIRKKWCDDSEIRS